MTDPDQLKNPEDNVVDPDPEGSKTLQEMARNVEEGKDSIRLESPNSEMLERAQKDPRVHYVPSLKQVDFSEDGGPIMDASQYYDEWKNGRYESHKAGIFTFGKFVMEPLQQRLQQDLDKEFPVSIRGVALNIDETINSGESNEVLGVSDVLQLGTERRDRTGDKIPTLRYNQGDRFPSRSQQWLQQSPKELRQQLDINYKNQIFPAVLVYKGVEKPELIGIYIVDFLDELEKAEQKRN